MLRIVLYGFADWRMLRFEKGSIARRWRVFGVADSFNYVLSRFWGIIFGSQNNAWNYVQMGVFSAEKNSNPYFRDKRRLLQKVS